MRYKICQVQAFDCLSGCFIHGFEFVSV